LIALEDLVAGLARNAECATDLAHRFAVQQLSDKPQALVHYRTLLPRHPHLPQKGNGVTHVSGTICYLCLGPLTCLARTGVAAGREPPGFRRSAQRCQKGPPKASRPV